jgi:hypothetical protein
MVEATFEHEGNSGLLKVITHFSEITTITCTKRSDETFRLGGTAINEVAVYEGLVLKLPTLPPYAHFRAFRTPEMFFEDIGVMSNEPWDHADRHCYVTEYYSLDMEGNRPGWFISKKPLRDANHLFINLDVLDGGGNVIKRYRVSPFTGEHKIMDSING